MQSLGNGLQPPFGSYSIVFIENSIASVMKELIDAVLMLMFGVEEPLFVILLTSWYSEMVEGPTPV